MISIPDLTITIAYFSIPVQILVALCRFPRLTRRATKRVVILLILFALFIFLCGTGHLLRFLNLADTALFHVVNILTAGVSLLTAVYLIPFVPTLLEGTDKLYLEATASKNIIESMYPPTIRDRLLQRDGDDPKISMEEGVNDMKKDGEDNTIAVRQKNTRNILARMSRSDSMALRRIHDFIQRKRGGSVLDESGGGQTCDSDPIADNFPATSIMFADISNFTLWSSNHSPNQVFTLLETLFFEFDQIASQMSVFKISTVGDCYIAATGVPYPREDHAIVLAQFAERCRRKSNEVMRILAERQDMGGVKQLNVRIGIHSGPVTAGVLRGGKARFDLFGDTINTAARIESTGKPDRIHLSQETAELLEQSGKADWLVPREEPVTAKGKGELKTFWLNAIYTKDDDRTFNGCVTSMPMNVELIEKGRGSMNDISNTMQTRMSENGIIEEDSSASVDRRMSGIV